MALSRLTKIRPPMAACAGSALRIADQPVPGSEGRQISIGRSVVRGKHVGRRIERPRPPRTRAVICRTSQRMLSLGLCGRAGCPLAFTILQIKIEGERMVSPHRARSAVSEPTAAAAFQRSELRLSRRGHVHRFETRRKEAALFGPAVYQGSSLVRNGFRMTRTAIRDAVTGCIAELTGRAVTDIADTQRLMDDLGVDSITAANLLLSVEERLGTTLPDGCEGSFVDVRTVGELVERFFSVLV